MESGEDGDRDAPTATGNDERSRVFLPGVRDADRAGRVHTYIADADSAFMRYPQGATGLRARQEVVTYDRNEIDKRYVLMYAAQGAAGGLVQGDRWSDPFDADTDCRHRTDNWFAIGMDFNAQGEFLGYISRWCSGAGSEHNSDNSIQMAVIATINSQCVDVASVYNDDVDILQQASNKAWTNRLWQGALSHHPLQAYRGNPDVPLRNTDMIPFGSVPLSNEAFEGDDLGNTLRTYFRFPGDSGIPYSCGGVPGNPAARGSCRPLLDVDDNQEKRAIAAQYPGPEIGIITGKNPEQAM